MFFFFSKFLGFLILPQGILLVLSLSIFLFRKNRTKVKRLALLLCFALYIFCSSFFVNTLASMWEVQEIELGGIEKHDYAVLLTGGLVNENSTNIQLGISGDRLWKALQLFQHKKIDQIIITGGDINPKKANENTIARQFLIENGVPASAILQETKAINTNENAIYTTQLVQNKKLGKNGILVSSAYHLKRAQACFKKQGIEYDIYPSDNFKKVGQWDIYSILPQAENFKKSELLMKEMVGYAVYKWNGYL